MELIANFLFFGLLIMAIIVVTTLLIWGVVLVIKYLKSLFEDIKSYNRDE